LLQQLFHFFHLDTEILRENPVNIGFLDVALGGGGGGAENLGAEVSGGARNAAEQAAAGSGGTVAILANGGKGPHPLHPRIPPRKSVHACESI
jgi:hypothetical protein